jgi:hypothetical protein
MARCLRSRSFCVAASLGFFTLATLPLTFVCLCGLAVRRLVGPGGLVALQTDGFGAAFFRSS